MKENKKQAGILIEDGSQSKISNLPDDRKGSSERFRKPAILLLMGIVFLGCMYLIFKPAAGPEQTENTGLNDLVPQASGDGMQADKQKAYEQEMLERKDQEKRNAMTTLSDYWNEQSPSKDNPDSPAETQDQSEGYGGSTGRSANPALNSYRSTQDALGSFYADDNSETRELRRQLDDLKEKLAEKDVPKGVSVDDQLALMEKSYQMAAKYLPAGTPAGEAPGSKGSTAPAAKQAPAFAAFSPAENKTVSVLYRKPSDSTFAEAYGTDRNGNLYASASLQQFAPKNSVKACVLQTQTIISEGAVRLRLLEPAQTKNRTIQKGTLLTAGAKFQNGRLQMRVASLELDGDIIPVDITIYGLDGQQGLQVPYSAEMSAITEMAGNMGQASGTSLMLTQSAAQQAAADLSRGVVQGISGYFSKKAKTQKVTLKAGCQVLLVSKN